MMNIKEICYELYKIDWKRYHMITPEREADALRNYYQEVDNGDWEDYTFEDYLNEVGYDGVLHACFEEFCDAEYKNVGYIRRLLDNQELFKKYLKDVANPSPHELKIQLSSGHSLVAQLCEYGSDLISPEIVVCIQDENGLAIQDIALVREAQTEEGGAAVLVWGDCDNEDYSDSYLIPEYKEPED